MIGVRFDYATPSAFQSDRERALLGFSADARRPVRFRGRVRSNLLSLRMALQTLGELIWSNETWMSRDDYVSVFLDPVITVHPDRVFFEAFSQDQSVYGLVIAQRENFEEEGETAFGTTNVDFTAWLWAALAEMRSSRDTWFRIEPAGFEVATTMAGGRFEKKVDLPDSWVRGFLQLQEAMAFPGTRLEAKAVDLLAAIRYLRFTKAKVSPRALRYEFEPGADARLVLEPWEKVIPLRGAAHSYDQLRTIRTWGRRRLRLIEPLLPYASAVDIYLKGRALPSFYAVKLPGVTFVLGLSGWTENTFTGTSSFDLAASGQTIEASLLERALRILERERALSAKALAEEMGATIESATQILIRLCRNGRSIYDIETRQYRHRELFETPVDEAKLYPPDPRLEEARRLVSQKLVTIDVAAPRETKKRKRLKTPDGTIEREIVYREWQVIGSAGDQRPVEIVINDSGRIIFGTCSCPFFAENILNLGPCTHMLALYLASDAQRRDLPTSRVPEGPAPPKKRARERDEERDEEEEIVEEEEDDEES